MPEIAETTRCSGEWPRSSLRSTIWIGESPRKENAPVLIIGWTNPPTRPAMIEHCGCRN